MSESILKLPLRADDAEIFDADDDRIARIELQREGTAKALCESYEIAIPQAAEIVRRVNAFDDLLAACKKGQRVISEIADITTENRAGWALKDLEAAIAKAKEVA